MSESCSRGLPSTSHMPVIPKSIEPQTHHTHKEYNTRTASCGPLKHFDFPHVALGHLSFASQYQLFQQVPSQHLASGGVH